MTAREFLFGLHGPVKDNHPETSTERVMEHLASAMTMLEREAHSVSAARARLATVEATLAATRARITSYQETVQARIEKAMAVAMPPPRPVATTVDDGERGIRLREEQQDGQGTATV
jgi:2C-methyl-D-erythritol 2,4-cyclodiphosphate synthase